MNILRNQAVGVIFCLHIDAVGVNWQLGPGLSRRGGLEGIETNVKVRVAVGSA